MKYCSPNYQLYVGNYLDEPDLLPHNVITFGGSKHFACILLAIFKPISLTRYVAPFEPLCSAVIGLYSKTVIMHFQDMLMIWMMMMMMYIWSKLLHQEEWQNAVKYCNL